METLKQVRQDRRARSFNALPLDGANKCGGLWRFLGESDHPEGGQAEAGQEQERGHLRVQEQHQSQQHQPADQGDCNYKDQS